MTVLRDYQKEMLDRLQRTWREGKRCVMVQMPTGTGKTVLLAALLKSLSTDSCPVRKGLSPDPSPKREGRGLARSEDLREENAKVLIVAHRRELIEQIKQTLAEFEIDEGTVVVESIQKLTANEKRKEKDEEGKGERRKEKDEIKGENGKDEVKGENGDFQLVVIDEAHHAQAKTYRALFERWPKAQFLGLTATPCRLSGNAFTDLFDVLLQTKDIQWFIKEGWLSDFEYVSVQPDSEEVRKVKALKKRGVDGDYQTKEMATVLDVKESIEHLYNTYDVYTRGKKGIVYAIDRAHAQHIAEYYSAHGVSACWIEAKTPAKERERLVREYREGRVDVIVNVDIFSEGFDCPEVEFIQLARPTLSLAKYLQQVGRGMRVSKGKPFVTILDQVGLYQTFGMPTDNRDWQKMFLGKMAGKGLAEGEGRPLIIRDEVADKGLLNLEMMHIKRFNERRTRLEVFLLNGRFGIMCMGHVTCSPQFRRVQRLRRSRFYALAVYDGAKENYTTVIDNEGRNMRLALAGEVSVKDDILIQKDAFGGSIYFDAISGNTYYRFPKFQMVAGMEVEDRMGVYYLRDWQDKLTTYLSKTGTHYNDHVVITEGILINKDEGNRQSRIMGFLGDSVLVSPERGIGYLQVFTDGRCSKKQLQKPKEMTTVPDWERLGLQSLGEEIRDEMELEEETRLRGYCRDFMRAMEERDQVWQDEHIDGSFQMSHEGHTASRPAFITAQEVRFHTVEIVSAGMQKEGGKVVFNGRIRVKYQMSTSRKREEGLFDFRLRMRHNGMVWRFTRAWFSKAKGEE